MGVEGAAFDAIGDRYEKCFVERDEQERAGAWVIERLPRGGRVLDLGCGSGVPTAAQFAAAGFEVVGVDESPRMVELARQKVPQARFVTADVREVPAELGEFDAAVAFFALLMVSRSEIGEVLAAVRRRLRGPRLVALSMVYGDFDLFPISFLGVPVRVTALPTDQLRDVVVEAGFEVRRVWEARAEVEPGRIERQVFLCAQARDD
ncbi:class I SAM-dependent DNA methyltransferase [Saccharopolyspora rosea]|uniref:Class I SAM-dependent DNA methyltransferase n=1 Tax=Saccharopolyspora rosea TaxID=524884 RepID=A0ABW3FWL8_9PSEU|nr:class I SAM-dependent methyltransferase [Saccharopolyspora rosea]